MNVRDQSPFELVNRVRACGNSRFDVFFDHIRNRAGHEVKDFLVVRPKSVHDSLIAGVAVLPERGGQIGLMHGYRHHLGQAVWQTPAGFIDSGETPAEAARRELREETGLSCRDENLQSLGLFIPDAGLIEAKVELFVASDVFQSTADIDTEPGSEKLTWFGLDEIETLAFGGDTGSATTVAIFRLLRRRNR